MTATANPTTIRTDVLVIGGGQAGLAAGYHLQRQGIDYRIVEADARIGDVWRRRYDSLKLYSPAGYAALPGMPFPLPKRAFPTGREMADYLESYAASFGLAVDTGVRIERLEAARRRRPAVRRHRRRSSLRGGPGHRRDRRVPATEGARLRDRARSRDPAAPFERLPQPVAARRRTGPGRRAEPLGRGPRPRDRRDPPGDPVGQVARPDAVLGR